MKKPISIFTSLAALALAGFGVTYYVNPALVKTDVAAVAEKVADVPAASVAAKPVEAAPKADEMAVAVAPETPKVEVAPEAPKVVVVPESVAPSFDTVRVEQTGDAIIAGRADANAEVTVRLNGNIVGTTKANAEGAFVLVPAKPLTTGTGALTLEVNQGGKIITSEGSVIVAVKDNAPALVAKVDPAAPTAVLQNGATAEVAKELQLSAVDYDAAGNIVFSGSAAPGSIVRFYVDNAAAGEGQADTTGKWSFKGNETVKPGTHTLRADAVDTAGAVISRIELPFLREDAAKVAEALVAMAPAVVAPVVEAPKAAAPAVDAAPADADPAVTPAPIPPKKSETLFAAASPDAAPANAAPVVAGDEGPKRLVIQPGNNLWKLSREVYGKGRMYTVIYQANRDQLKNPNKIFPGQILTAPKQN
jgi:nucleoid-associated protein YgaU